MVNIYVGVINSKAPRTINTLPYDMCRHKIGRHKRRYCLEYGTVEQGGSKSIAEFGDQHVICVERVVDERKESNFLKELEMELVLKVRDFWGHCPDAWVRLYGNMRGLYVTKTNLYEYYHGIYRPVKDTIKGAVNNA